jgi:hypothetical protein
MLLMYSAFAQAQFTVKPIFGKTTSQEGGQSISNVLDDDVNSMYEAEYSVTPNAIPDVIDFYFNNVQNINKLEYLPRSAGNLNGVWTKVDIYYSTLNNPNVFILYQANVILADDNTLKTIDLTANPISNPKWLRIIVQASHGNFSTCREMKFYSSVAVSTTPIADCESPTAEFDNLAVTPVDRTAITATASPVGQSGLGIEKTLDGTTTGYYHSLYSTPSVDPAHPAILTYIFPATSQFNTVRYTPHGGNGNFGQIDIYFKQTAGSAEQLLLSYDCGLSNNIATINLGQTLVDIDQLIIKVKTSVGGFASCNEMEFLKTDIFTVNQYDNIFNELHSALKPGIGQTQINSIASPFFKSLAQCLLNGTYQSRYRAQNAERFEVPSTVHSRLKTNGATTIENATGVVFKANSKAVIYVGTSNGTATSLQLHTVDFAGEDNLNEKRYPLQPGINIIDITADGLGYIDYFSNDTNLGSVAYNVITGLVNGYYDPLVDTDQDWQNMLTNNVYPKIDVKGVYVFSHIHKQAMRNQLSFLSGKPWTDALDKIVKTQYEMLGYFKYNLVPKNHILLYTPVAGGTYAGIFGPHMGIGATTELSGEELLGGSIWGYAHELGHINQVRPAFRWNGMLEVTNNIYSAYSQYSFGTAMTGFTRYEREATTGGMSGYYSLVSGSQYNASLQLAKVQRKSLYEVITKDDRATCRAATIPFWQLMLYYSEAGAAKNLPTYQERLNGTPAVAGQADVGYWFPDLMEICRNANTSGVDDIQLMLNAFVNTADVVKEDLSDFFLNSGYLSPVDQDVDGKQMTLTAQQIANTIAIIKAKNYPAPASPVINYISANSLNIYKNKLPLAGTAMVGVTLNPNADPQKVTLTVNASQWQNAVAFETYNQETLIDVAIFGTNDISLASTTVRYLSGATSVYAVGYNGVRKLVYPAVDDFNVLPVTLLSFAAKKTNNGALLSWKTASEQNNAKFEVYKKVGDGNFVKIGEKAGAGTTSGNSNYEFLDRQFNQSAYYYIKQVDKDGKATVYDGNWIRFVENVDGNKITLIYPNPATTSFSIKAKTSDYQVKISDVNGKVLNSVKSNGSLVTEINISNLSAGVYLVQVISENEIETKKLIKN